MVWYLQERRHRRSIDQFVALRYQLEHAREQGRIEAMVLADDSGVVVASSGDRAVCTELGAMAPLMSRTAFGLPPSPLLRGAEVAVRPLRVYGQRLYLACVGGGVARDAHLSRSMDGVHRILASN